MKTIDKNYFPGWVRKSISFTIDDGKLDTDKKFIDIVKPYGIKGTFNISNFHFDQLSPEGYRELYRGYEIANHCRYHPYPFIDGKEYVIKDGPHPEHAQTPLTVYKEDVEGLYTIELTKGWRRITDADNYIRFTRECTAQIEEVFGKKKKIAFVWPFGMQNNQEVIDRLDKEGFYAIRGTRATEDTTGFAIPKNRMRWAYNANHLKLLSVSEKFEAYPDDGTLKAFIFGVHSVDFERSENWCDLEKFAREFGNRPEKYWYATNVEIFDYEDAANALIVTEEKIENPTDVRLYITVDGERIIIEPHSVFAI